MSQVIISGVDGRASLSQHMKTLFKEIPPGGVMFFSYNLNTSNDSIKSFINEIVTVIKDETTGGKHLGIAPFVSVDHEGGGINRFLPGVARLPAASSYWKIFQEEGIDAALARIEADSKRTANDISALGFNLNFAPVAESIIDDNRRFLFDRSYGPDPSFSAQAAAAFIKGMEQSDILCVIKHFPGVAGIDPHFHSSVLNMDLTSLKKLVYPFEFLIKNGARAVMTTHTLAAAIDKNKISSFSPIVIQNWLRDEIGFKGIVISDDFNMKSIGNISIEEAAVQAVIAGTDLILIWPTHLKRTYNALLKALEDGRLTRERLLEAVNRILYEKIRMGLVDWN
ncbi:MAG: glycoside hydrolase family 3 protein [Treponema sp.]|nr:glycoside hydrolase family 3 protein [Treponema sp.]